MTRHHVNLRAHGTVAPPLRITITGRPADHPAQLVEAAARQAGLRVAILRVESDRTAHVELLNTPTTTRPADAVCVDAVDDSPIWQRPGWLSATIGEVDVELNRLGLRRTGVPVQERHSAVTGMLRIPVGEACVWLKAGLPLFRREAPVTSWVAERAAAAALVAPIVLAETDTWWLAEAFPDAAAGPAEDSLVALARLQAASVGHERELHAMGCLGRAIADLVDEVDALAERTDLLGDASRQQLRRARRVVAEAGACARECLPDTLVHGDFHSDNVRWTTQGWLVYDWTDACIAHPFVDLASAVVNDPPARAAARACRYADAWAAARPGANIAAALWTAPIVGAAFHVVNYCGILDAVAPPGTGRDRIAAREPTAAELIELLDLWVAQLDTCTT
jgi:hypothetical protein